MIRQLLIIAAFLGFFTSTAVASYAFINNPRNNINIAWAALSFFVGFTSFGWGMLIISKDIAHAAYWLNICFFGGFFIPSSFLHFVYSFLGKKSKTLVMWSYFASSIFFILFLLNHIAYPEYVQAVGFYWWRVKWLYNAYVLHLVSAALFGLFLFYNESLKIHGLKKIQLLYLIFASALGFSSGATVFLPAYGIPMIPFGIFPFFIYPLVVAYAMVKFRLMDVIVVVRKGLVYSLTIGTIAGLYVSVILVFGRVLQGMTQGAYFSLILFLIIVFAVAFQPLLNLTQQLIDKLFFKSKYEYQQTLKSFSSLSTSIIQLDVLAKTIIEKVTEVIKVDGASILIINLGSNNFDVAYKKGGQI